MIRGKRIKPVFPIEYRLLIAQKRNEREDKTVTFFGLRTVTEFSNFRYDIIADAERTDRTLHFHIRGIRAPQTSIPSSGPALFKTEMEDLKGDYDLVISKHGKEVNIFKIIIKKDDVIISSGPRAKFVEVVTSETEW